MKSNLFFALSISLIVLLLGAISNVPGMMACAATLNTLWAVIVICAHIEPKPKSKLTSKPRPVYRGRALT